MKLENLKRVAVAALFLCLISGCATLDPPVLVMDRRSAWVQIMYVDPPIMYQGREVDGTTECAKPGVCRVKLRADKYPYGCLTHEIVHVFSGNFHDLEVPNGDYCLN